MHVLVAAHDLYPDPGSGGTGRYVFEVTRRLADRGHDVSVVTRRRGDVPYREVREGVSVFRYDFEVADRSAPGILRDVPDAATAVDDHVSAARSRAGPPDVVSYQGPVTATLVDRAVSDDVPRFVTFHSPWPTEYRLKTRGESGVRRSLNVAVRRFVEGRLLDSADHLVALSEFMLGESHRVYDHDLPASVVPGGVDAEVFTPEGATDRLDGDPAFLTVRRLSERMGHDVLLEAFETVVDRHPDAHLYVAGDGPLREELEATARRLDVAGATTFLGYVPDDDLPRLYRSADVFVLPTVALEGFGLATLEALASGLPVVATPVGGTTEVLDGLDSRDGMPAPALAAGPEPDALADGMAAWAALDPSVRDRAGTACRRYATERFPWTRTVAEVERLCESLVDGEPATVGNGRRPPYVAE